MGQTRNQPRDQVKGIHGRGANCPAMHVSHVLSTAVTPENSTTSIQNVCGLFSVSNGTYRSKNSRNNQDRGGSEKVGCSQSETLLYDQRLSRPEIPMPRVWKSAADQNWTD